MAAIPISVIVSTRNEERNIARCLKALEGFEEILVVDSESEDRTCDIAAGCGARVIPFVWNGQYPKKRQWILDNIPITQDWVFWVDADEVVTPALKQKLQKTNWQAVEEAGFFIRGRYVWRGTVLQRGMMNNKIALMHKTRMMFPVVDDLHIAGMGEMEGHYQPVLTPAFHGAKIGQMEHPLRHYAYDDEEGWTRRHQRYALWEAEMTLRGSWPVDPVPWREAAKRVLRTSPLRPWVMFFHSYVVKRGFLDGKAGLDFALSRKRYCTMIRRELKTRS